MDIIYTVHIKEIDLVYSTNDIDKLFEYIHDHIDPYTKYSDVKIYAFTDKHIISQSVEEFKDRIRRKMKEIIPTKDKLDYMIKCTDSCDIEYYGNSINELVFNFNWESPTENIEFFTTINPHVLDNNYKSIDTGTLVTTKHNGGKYIVVENLNNIIDSAFECDSYVLEGINDDGKYHYYDGSLSYVDETSICVCDNQDIEEGTFLYYMREVALGKRRYPTLEEYRLLKDEMSNISDNSWKTLDWATDDALI